MLNKFKIKWFEELNDTTCVTTICLATLLIHGLLLLNQGVYWDGRLWYELIRRDEFDTLWWSLDQAKIQSFYYLASFLKKIGSILFLFKLITFLSFLSIGLSFFFLIQKTFHATKAQSLLASIVTIAAPVALIHIELCLVQYYVFMSFFVVGHTIFAISINSEIFSRLKKCFLTFLAFLLIYVSFIYPSLLCIHYGFIGFLFVKNTKKIFQNAENQISIFIAVIIPIVAYLSRDQPFGLYAGYNKGTEIGLHLLTSTFDISFRYFAERMFIPLNIERPGPFFGTILSIAMLSLGALFLFFKKIERKEKKTKLAWLTFYLMLTAGIIFLCVFPYIYVGKAPQPQSWKQRNGIPLTLAIPISFMTLDYFSSLLSQKSQKFFRTLIVVYIGLCFQIHLRNYIAWDLDWFKQIKLTEAIRSQVDQSLCNQIKIIDKSRHLNAQGRHYLDYDWNSILSEAYGNRASVAGSTWEDRASIENPKLPKGLVDADLTHLRKFYISEDFKADQGGRCTLTVESRLPSADKITLNKYLRLKLLQLHDQEKLVKSETLHLATSVEYEKP